MDLKTLFETQELLDERIVEGKGLKGKDLLPEKILALQVELGELANEWRGFKYWSENQKPNDRTLVYSRSVKVVAFVCTECNRTLHLEEAKQVDFKCDLCEGELTGVGIKNSMLEEYVDCLHFILSIGNDLGLSQDVINNANFRTREKVAKTLLAKQFHRVFVWIANMSYDKSNYYDVAMEFMALGSMLGFTWRQIEQAYYEKNKINHNRQDSGY